MYDSFQFFIGIDWAKQEHTVCALNAGRSPVSQRIIPHTGTGLEQLVEWLHRLGASEPSRIAVGIETPRGAVVETLVERGFRVFSLNPKQMDRFRDRFLVAGAKDDSRDALVIASALATDMALFHPVRLDDPHILRIRELSRAHEDLQQDHIRTCHQLRELLNRYFPQILHLSPSVDEPWVGDLLAKAPLPARAARLTLKSLQSLLAKHRIRRIDAATLQETLRQPPLWLAPGAADAVSEHVLLLLPLLRLQRRQSQQLDRRLDDLLEQMSTPGQPAEHRDAKLLLSLPGVGRRVAATMLAEASQALAERDYHALRSYAGVAPLTRQ